MTRDHGEQGEVAVFADAGVARHWLLRAGVVGGAALLVAWLVALALGALGGFQTLPALPGQGQGDSKEGASATRAPVERAPVAQTRDRRATDVDQPATAPGSSAPRPPSSPPAPQRTPRAKPAPSPSPSVTTADKPGKRIGTTTDHPIGQPAEVPGNGPGGTGPPGQTP
jgi:hypothetical protein